MEIAMNKQILAGLIVLVAVLPAGASTQEARLPDTEAGRIAESYFKILNTGEDQDMLKFIVAHIGEAARKRRSDEERLGVFHEMRAKMGQVRFHSVLKSEPSLLSVLVETERTGWVSFDFVFEAGPPGKLDSIRVEQAEPPM
jgi:hypothetical protein